ncbi:hypothetical protein GGI11_000195 [Coemansia sp. RSA 2049]|nr:hypothetical protein H4217_000159 [Coemansia sp. RSA 1939]KAJ2525224.1 hypothetical protein GGI11_000195 [Coemansia sp. RSA 2049]KAJ2617752.1 hypothetical protein EV177_000383 [Coemansia sp. RSA 1804]KAJ2694307.1 hypothetical protein GGH99_000739 [Coemansia sp. RSA 1285]
MYPRAPLSLVLVVVASMLVAVPLEAAAAAATRAGDHRAPTRRRQLIGGGGSRGIAAVEGMGDRESSPFAAFWNQGLVPGQGFPQVGMSAYGYALPGLGLNGFLSPDALILARAGQGDVTNKDLDRIDDSVYGGFDRPRDSDGAHAQPDPAYPGCFASERCSSSTPIAAAAAAAAGVLSVSQLSLLSAIAVAVALGF